MAPPKDAMAYKSRKKRSIYDELHDMKETERLAWGFERTIPTEQL
jgi:hypothetical protein